MAYKDGDYGILADGIMNCTRNNNFEIPPKVEVLIGDQIFGIWEFDDTFGYCEKLSRGYNRHMIIQIDKKIINAMKGD